MSSNLMSTRAGLTWCPRLVMAGSDQSFRRSVRDEERAIPRYAVVIWPEKERTVVIRGKRRGEVPRIDGDHGNARLRSVVLWLSGRGCRRLQHPVGHRHANFDSQDVGWLTRRRCGLRTIDWQGNAACPDIEDISS